MRSAVVALLSAVPAVLSKLVARQDNACYQDDCLRAVNGMFLGPNHPLTATSDCLSYFVTTVGLTTETSTVTTERTLTFTVKPAMKKRNVDLEHGNHEAPVVRKRQVESAAVTTTKNVPPYATEACISGEYESACSCIGVTATRITWSSTAHVTRTVTITFFDTVTATPSQSQSQAKTTPSMSLSTGMSSMSGRSSTLTLTTGPRTGMTSISTPIWTNSTSHANSTTSLAPSTTLRGNSTTTSSSASHSASCSGDPGLTLCPSNSTKSAGCVNLRMDAKNCGSCGNACPNNSTCTNGLCNSNSCTASTCGSFTSCGSGATCVCGSIIDGTGFCVDGNTSCSSLAGCESSDDCPIGQVCSVGSCCRRNVCIGAGNGTCGVATARGLALGAESLKAIMGGPSDGLTFAGRI